MAQPSDRLGRFTDDQGGNVYAGLREGSVSQQRMSNKQLKKALKPYRKYLPKNLNKLGKMTTGELEAVAARAVMKKNKNKPDKLRTGVNKQRFGAKRIAYAKRVMANTDPSKMALKRTADTRKHIRFIRRNRKIMKAPLYPGIPWRLMK